jgi:catechol 2,3-dioxygenase
MEGLEGGLVTSVKERASLVQSSLIDHIARVDLRVTDIDKALSFYRDVVGLEVVEQDSHSAHLQSRGGPGFLSLNSSGVTRPADPTATGLFHTALRFPSRPALGDALARLVEAGLEIGAGDHLVSEALYIDDPDGNGVELYWDRPVDEWPAPAGGMIVPMATLAVDLQGLFDEGSGRAAAGEPAPSGTNIGHVHLQVSDVDQTIAFYSKVLGLDLTARLGSSAGFFSSNGYHHHIGANTWRSRGQVAPGRDRAGLERIVLATSREEIESLRSRLAEAGVEIAGHDQGLVVIDPDGIELEFANT